MPTEVRLLTPEDSAALVRVRQEAYAREHGTSVDLRFLRRGAWDDLHFNLGAFVGPKLASVLRIALVMNPKDFHFITACDFDDSRWAMPVTVFHRAATQEEHLGRGLHSLLRFHGLKISRALGARWAFSAVAAGVPRLLQLEEMGYELFEQNTGWTEFLKSGGPTYLAGLRLENDLDGALNRLSRKHNALIQSSINGIDMETLFQKYPRRER